MPTYEEINRFCSSLSPEDIERLPEDTILDMAVERPAHPEHYGFLLHINYFRSAEHLAETAYLLMKRLTAIEGITEKMRQRDLRKIESIFENIADRQSKPASQKIYTVMVADNFHYMDESEWYEHNGYPKLDEAIAACKMIVDDCLEHLLKYNAPERLYDAYVAMGEDPFILSDDTVGIVPFSAWTYAKQRCEEMLQPKTKDEGNL